MCLQFKNKFKVVQHCDHKQFADVAHEGLYDQNKIQNRIILYSIGFQKIYTLLG